MKLARGPRRGRTPAGMTLRKPRNVPIDPAGRTLINALDRTLADGDGVLALEPAWVARDMLPAGRRLGLPGGRYGRGERGAICERWLASTTHADNRVGPPGEGLSHTLLVGGLRVSLKTIVDQCAPVLLGVDYAVSHAGLGRLAKVFDYAGRLPLHVHHRAQHAALVGRNPKEEAYYFPPGVDMGAQPETFFGVHPWMALEREHEVLLPYLEKWDSDLILRFSRAFRLAPDEGYHVPAGVLHAPGSALTIELQEDSDVMAVLQARVGNHTLPKEMLFKDVRAEDRSRLGERFILELIDWATNGDPYFYENHHLVPRSVEGSQQVGGEEHWIFYNSRCFSGKKLVVRAGESYESTEPGVYSLFVWAGRGRIGNHDVVSRDPYEDELLVTHDRALLPLTITNTGDEGLVIFKFFGPDVQPDAPWLTRWQAPDGARPAVAQGVPQAGHSEHTKGFTKGLARKSTEGATR